MAYEIQHLPTAEEKAKAYAMWAECFGQKAADQLAAEEGAEVRDVTVRANAGGTCYPANPYYLGPGVYLVMRVPERVSRDAVAQKLSTIAVLRQPPEHYKGAVPILWTEIEDRPAGWILQRALGDHGKQPDFIPIGL